MKKVLFVVLLSINVWNVIAQPVTNIKNSWVGNSFGLPSLHIPHNMDNMYVTPSGKVAIITSWDEGGHNVVIFDNNGNQIGVPVESGTGSFGRNSGQAVFLDDTYLYQVMSQHGCDGANGNPNHYPVCGTEWKCIRRYNINGSTAPFLNGKGYDQSMLVVSTDEKGLNGVVVYNNELYVSDAGAENIKVYNATTMNNVPVRSFSVGSGGLMDYDSQGNIWMLDIQKQKLIRFSTAGVVLPQQIVFPNNVEATAFCVDKTNNRILVTNNGIDQNVLIYTNIFTNPVQTSTFGIKGGINAGVQGEIAPLKLSEPKGVGVDNLGNIYVANNGLMSAGGRLEKYNTSNVLQWQKLGLMFTDNAGIDAETETDFYSKEFFIKLNLQNQTPGSEWSVKASTLNRFAFPEDARINYKTFWTTSYFRNVLGQKILFTTDMYGSSLLAHKFSPSTGAIAIPSVSFWLADNQDVIWTDINNNQKHENNEYDKVTALNIYSTHIVPDKAGNVWKTNRENGIRYFPVKGIDANGNPIYSYATATLFANPPGMHDVKRLEYDNATGDLYLTGRNTSSISDEWWSAGNTLAKYSNFLANPTAPPTWSVSLPYLPVTDDNVKTFCLEGDYIFTVAARLGKVVVRNKSNGNVVGEISPGASTDFKSGWADINGAIQAHKRPNGEYLVFVEENGYGKVMMYRWCPSGSCVETSNSLVINTNYLNYAAASSAKTISITSNINWTVSGIPAWATLSTTSGNGNRNIQITASANGTGVDRNAIITISGSGISKRITLNQQFLDTQAPSGITGLSSSKITPFSFELSWNTSTDNAFVSSYEIYRNGVPFTTTTGTRLTIDGLTPNTAHNMTVRAIDASNNRSAFASINVSTLVLTFPYITARGDNPQWNEGKEKAFDGDNNSKWSDNSRESWIQIQYAAPVVYNQYIIVSGNDVPMRDPETWSLEASNNGSTWTTLDSRTSETWTGRNQARPFIFANKTPYAYYRINITENNGENAIQLSEIIYSNVNIVDTQAPSTPRNLSPSNITQNTLTLSWEPSIDNVVGVTYEVFRAGVSVGTTTSTNISISGLACNNTYSFTVKAKDATGNVSAFSASLSVKTDLCINSTIDKINIDNQIVVHPNPTKKELYINGNILENSTYQIFSMEGMSLYSGVLEDNTISVEHLKQGIYILKIKSSSVEREIKFIKE